MDRIVFHIGLHKTGSSWLQQHYFRAHPELQLLCDPTQPWDDPFLRSIIAVSDREFESSFSQSLLSKKLTVNPRSRIPIVSSERLSGHPFSGGYDNFRIAERLRACCDNVQVICIVRNQPAIIYSVYKQLIIEGYPLTFDSLLNTAHWKSPGFDLSFFKYHLLIEKYFSLFGPENVCILPYELMHQHIDYFINLLSRFIGASDFHLKTSIGRQNVSLPNGIAERLRYLNYFKHSELNPCPLLKLHPRLHQLSFKVVRKIAALLPAPKKSLAGRNLRTIQDYYLESNKKLKKLVGWDFTDYQTVLKVPNRPN